MPSSFTLFGVTFHIYGLILGVAILVTLKIAESCFKHNSEKRALFWNSVVWMLLGALVGARVWHVITDWSLYRDSMVQVLYVWNGGLSIVGALMGIFVGMWISVKRSKGKLKFGELSDAVVLGLPFGQAVGRLGNWFNQELYGLPTNLPWKLYIDLEHRLTGFEQVEYYHPLFAYEALILIGVGSGLWVLARKNRMFKIGTGMVTALYFALYGWIRFALEFLRMEKAVVGTTGLGVNQVIMLLVATVATFYILKKVYVKK